jgi:hypothetical protein
MTYRILADLVVAAHLLFILFGLLGGFLVLWRRWCLLLHLPAVAWICALEFNSWICPLTPLENSLRLRAGEAGYSGGFVEHYLIPLIYPAGLTSSIQLILGIGALTVNIAIYTWVLRYQRQRKTHGEKSPDAS